MKRLLPALALLLLARPCGAAIAQFHPPAACRHFESTQWYSCLIEQAGGPPRASLSGSFLRVVSFDGTSGLILQFEARPDGTARLEIRDPGAVQQPLVADASSESWSAIKAAWKKLLPDVARANAARERMAICDRPSASYVESNAGGALVSIDANECDNPDEIAFGDLVAERALDDAAPCGALEAGDYRTAAQQLEACLSLRGDKASAARALNAMARLDRYDADNPKDSLRDYLRVTAPMASLKVAGRSAVTGGAAVARAWADAWADASDMRLEIDAARGAEDRVTLDGSIWKAVKAGQGMLFLRAPCHQTWKRQKDGSFKLESLSIGGFAKDRMQ